MTAAIAEVCVLSMAKRHMTGRSVPGSGSVRIGVISEIPYHLS